MDNEASFEYIYSAPEQDEIRKIRNKYLPPDQRETKMERLRRLDASVTKKGTMVSIIVGVASTLVLGVGMSICMAAPQAYLVPGIVVGVIGIIGIALAYPLYRAITQKEQERIAPEILKLTEELMQ